MQFCVNSVDGSTLIATASAIDEICWHTLFEPFMETNGRIPERLYPTIQRGSSLLEFGFKFGLYVCHVFVHLCPARRCTLVFVIIIFFYSSSLLIGANYA